MIDKNKDWFRIKAYLHIGLPLKQIDRQWVEKYVRDPRKVSKHSFSPFIHRLTETRKFRREIADDGTRSKMRKPSKKVRDLYYANHLDSNILSYYAHQLSIYYEKKLEAENLSECVTAYRRIKLNLVDHKSRNKCNVDFANDVFSYIKNSNEKFLVAITFDIKSFFDNLDHKILKKAWRELVPSFTGDHYNVFRNITKFSYVDEDVLFDYYKSRISVERHPRIVKQIPVERKKYLRDKRAIAFCRKHEITDIRNAGLIKANKYEFDKVTNQRVGLRKKGIPQGSSISSVLANLYLLDFDKSANILAQKFGGIYRRYSDDMIVVCNRVHAKDIIKFFQKEILKYKLEIQKHKTQVFEFRYLKTEKRYRCKERNQKTNRLQSNTSLEYLGFQFDGKYTMLKNASLAGYYRKLKQSVARGKFYTLHNKTKTKGELFKARLYKRFTQVGAERRRIYQRDKVRKNMFIKSNRYDWGNYLTYAILAANTIADNKIGGQIKRHWNKFHVLLR
ncbi:MAG: reverse transcriptase domain-containing protein [Pseudobacter sp.]|uniref:reverse transcriptase domain-containing protein n=1 Tax=Pseudobacter sp. TaxID=2045420 RepID=UPI003F809257